MKPRRVRALSLIVAEADDMLASLVDARAVKSLNGHQRQQLEDAYLELSRVRRNAIGGSVEVPVEILLQVLRCASMTQHWLRDMFDEYVSVDTDE